jgi:hypothetical protein
MNALTLIIVTVVNEIPDNARMAIFPALKVLSLILGVPLFEDGTFDR